MQILRQSTQVIVRVGPFVDVGDGFTPQTDIALSGDEAELLKNASVEVDISGNTWAAVTNCRGWYDLTLTTGDTDTVGLLTVVVQDDSDCLPVFRDFQVIDTVPFDEMFKDAAVGIQGVIEVNNLDHLMKVAVSNSATMPEVVDDTVLANIMTKTDGDTSDFDFSTDSLEAIRDKLTDVETDTAELGAAVGADLSADIAAIKAETVTILADTGTTLENRQVTIAADAARLTAVRAAVLTDLIDGGRLDLLIDAIKVVTDNLADSATTLISGTVSWDNTNATTTVFYSDDIIEATADHYNGRIVIFFSGALLGQATDITDYALVAAEGKFTVTALTEAPADNVTFVIV